MKSELSERQATLEKVHWWFVARRQILENVIAGLRLPSGARILEAGCGSGGNLQMLARHGKVYAFDMSEVARHYAVAEGYAQVAPGKLPFHIPFSEDNYDLIVVLDVMEHIEDDWAAFKALRTRLKPGGYLLVTVPALPELWSYHDDLYDHFRRYRKIDLANRVLECGYKLVAVTYFNTLLFPVVGAVRFLRKLVGIVSHDLVLPRPWINGLLARIFAAERHLVGVISLPIGISLLAIARAPLSLEK